MARSPRNEEPENHERWLVSYADFITLLFAFFVVLYATSTQNLEKQKSFEQSIRAQLQSILPAATGAMGGGPQQSVVIDPLDSFLKKDMNHSELQEYVEGLLQKEMDSQNRTRAIRQVRQDPQGVRILLEASTFFPSGSVKIKRDALSALDQLSQILVKSPYRLIIEGHTDDQPVKMTGIESNWELGSLRATSVVRYMIKVHNFDPARLSAVSFADTKPIVNNDTEENRAKNRRIEILLVNAPDVDKEVGL